MERLRAGCPLLLQMIFVLGILRWQLSKDGGQCRVVNFLLFVLAEGLRTDGEVARLLRLFLRRSCTHAL